MNEQNLMNYEHATKLWAAKKYDVPVETIQSVSIDHYKGTGGCDTCDYGGECEFNVTIHYTDSSPKRAYHEETYFDLSTLLKELLEITDTSFDE